MLEELAIVNYRNIKEKKISFAPSFNCFLGQNGVGKTNILESIHFFANARSFRFVPSIGSLVMNGEKQAKVKGVFSNYLISYTVNTEKREYFFNDNKLKGMYEILDFLSVVSYAPTFYDLVNTSNNLRISYLDKLCFINNREYIRIHQYYKRVLKERNTLLKENKSVDTWDNLLEKYGSFLVQERQRTVEKINNKLKELFKLGYSFGKHLSVGYKTNVRDDFKGRLSKNKTKDYILGYTSIGPHRDQLDLYIADKPIKGLLSTGESKIFTFVLKLVELSFSKDRFDETVFIYDDAGAFLDENNFFTAMDILRSLNIQVLMSSVDKKLVACNNFNDSMTVNL